MSVNKDLLVIFLDIIPENGDTYGDTVFIRMAVVSSSISKSDIAVQWQTEGKIDTVNSC
jgi:hypothetical protein